MGVDLSFGVATDPSQRVPVLQHMIANNSIQQHIVCLSLSLVVCVSVLSVCSRVSCGFVALDGGGGGCCWWAVAGCWCLASLRVRVSLCRLVPSFFCSCLVLSCLVLCVELCLVLCCVVVLLSSLFVREWNEIFGFVSKRTIAKAFATDVFH